MYIKIYNLPYPDFWYLQKSVLVQKPTFFKISFCRDMPLQAYHKLSTARTCYILLKEFPA